MQSAGEVGGRAEVVGVDVGFEDVVDGVVVLGYEGEEGVCGGGEDGGGEGVEVQDWVDEDGGVGGGTGDQVLVCACCGLVDGVDDRLDGWLIHLADSWVGGWCVG